MIESITGRLAGRRVSEAVLEVGGIGVRLAIPLSTFEQLPEKGTVTLLCEMHVSDAQVRLFGFASGEEREVFRQLNRVNGIGPTVALGILSGMQVREFARAVVGGKVSDIERIRGIGPKKAQRIVVELRDSLRELAAITGGKEATEGDGASQDAVRALETLGFSRLPAETAVREALRTLPAGRPVEEILRAALKNV